jgi:hypothetical protein
MGGRLLVVLGLVAVFAALVASAPGEAQKGKRSQQRAAKRAELEGKLRRLNPKTRKVLEDQLVNISDPEHYDIVVRFGFEPCVCARALDVPVSHFIRFTVALPGGVKK